MTAPDSVGCEGVELSCHVGFHAHEIEQPQKILVDITAFLQSSVSKDAPDALAFDYEKASRKMSEFLHGRRFNLIETLAAALAEHLLKEFAIAKVKVRVHKFPKDMPHVKSVFCECERAAA